VLVASTCAAVEYIEKMPICLSYDRKRGVFTQNTFVGVGGALVGSCERHHKR
jgi:hypothetical protein